MSTTYNNAVGPQVRAPQPKPGAVIPFLACASLVFGLQSATQFFAYTFNYQDVLGDQFGGLYKPWAILEWALRWMSDYPLQFLVKLTKFCNLRCGYCYEYAHLGKRERMSPALLRGLFASTARFLSSPTGRRIHPTFVFHGGEPLLLGRAYFEDVLEAQRPLREAGIAFANSVQTNLYAYDGPLIRFLADAGFSIGVSCDVAGDARPDRRGKDSTDRVVANLDALAREGIATGGVAVLTRDNIGDAVRAYGFFNARRMACQFIPAFWQPYMAEDQRGYGPTSDAVVSALISVAREQLSSPDNVLAYPVYDHAMAALRSLRGEPAWQFDPVAGEWCLVCDLDGDIYSYGDAYTPVGRLGNVMQDELATLMSQARRAQSIASRRARAGTCEGCEFGRHCNRIPVIESHASDRFATASGSGDCRVAKRVIAAIRDDLAREPARVGHLLRQRLASRRSTIVFDG